MAVTISTVSIGEFTYTINLRSHSKGDRWSATCADFPSLIAYGNSATRAKEKIRVMIMDEVDKDNERHAAARDGKDWI